MLALPCMITHIVNNLWLGSQYDADELIHSNPENITAILNVRGPDAYNPPGRDQSSEHPDKTYKWIPAPDTGFISPKHMKEALAWLKEQTGKQERILIHCKHGISRSAGFLAAFMVESGISASLDEASATISDHRPVIPATPIQQHVEPAVIISAVTGLPNRHAFDTSQPAPFVALANIDFMKHFNRYYSPMAGDELLRRLATIFLGVGLDAYHSQADEFLCKGETREDLHSKLTQASLIFREPFQISADGRVQTIAQADFSFVIGTTLPEVEAALREAKKATSSKALPEWLWKMISVYNRGKNW